jgi:transcriptional regulator with XRE-family HTH domain
MDFDAALSAVLEFGLRVRAQRLSIGMSQRELGCRSRVTRKFIREMERGTSNPSLVTMVLVARALGCSRADLLQSEVITGVKALC